MKILRVQQGSREWHAERARRFTASEAPAMMGASKYLTRSALLQQKTTGLVPEVSAQQQALFDRGHASEANARKVVEEMLGEPLYPATAVHDDDDRLLASFDGATMAEDVIFEHKLWSEDLAAQVRAGELEPHYTWQLEQQLLVSGAERAIFVCSDGTRERFVHMEYRPVPGRREALLAGWDQFARDLAAYVPTEIKERPAAEVTIALPALVIHAKGEITTSNMKEYGEALARRLAEVRAIALVSDQDFSNAKESAKLLRENIQQAKLAKEQMLAQTVTVGEAARLIDTWCEDMRLTALKLEQDVEREDRAKKAAMIAKAKADYDAHIEALKADTGGPWTLLTAPDWASAIKGKRNFASMQDALDTMLANAKIVADESARKIRAALAAMDEEAKGYETLFADRLSFISKPVDDVRQLARARIAAHKAEQQRRAEELAERERARIRAEEAARVEREAQERAAAERRQREAAAAEQRRQEQEAAARAEQERQQIDADVHIADGTGVSLSDSPPMYAAASKTAGPAVIPLPTRAPAAPAGPPTLKLGEINARLSPIQLTAEGLVQLGFPVVSVDRGAKLYREESFPAMCDAVIAAAAKAKLKQLEAA